MKVLPLVAICAAAMGFAVGGLLTFLLLISYDPDWAWISNLTASGWAGTLVPSVVALAIAMLSSVWAWKVLLAPTHRSGWLLPVALGSWWFTWWLVPSNLAVLGIDAAQGIDWDTTEAPPDTALWVVALSIGAAIWLLTLLLWYARRRDGESAGEPGVDG